MDIEPRFNNKRQSIITLLVGALAASRSLRHATRRFPGGLV